MRLIFSTFEYIFGTEFRIRRSRPSAGYEVQEWGVEMTVITSTGNGITGSTRLQPVVRLRITRRGKLVAALALAILVFSIAWLGLGGSAVATDSAGAGDLQYVTVQSGQSLWDLAHSIAPTADPRDVIAELSRLNGIQGSVIHPGEQLAIPPIYSR